MIQVLLAAFLVGVVPGWFWASCLVPTADRAERLAYSVALSIVLVPAVTLALVRLWAGSVTFPVAVISPLIILGMGFVAYLRFGSPEEPDRPLVTPPVLPGALALMPIVAGFALVLGSDLKDFRLFWIAVSCWGWYPPEESCLMSVSSAQRFMLPVALLLLTAGIVHLLASSRELESRVRPPEPEPSGHQGSRVVVLARRLLLPAVLVLVLARGYLGPALNDWPYIRGLDLYSHAVMSELMMTEGKIEPYLIYPPGFHTLIAAICRLSGLMPLEVFPVLAPALLLLPALASYSLARRLWGWHYGVAAALFSGLLVGGTYYYYNDAMYPNLVASQFLMVLAVAALVGLYAWPSWRSGLLLALLGSSVVLYHQVASLYEAALLALVAVLFLPYLLIRERRMGLALLCSMALVGFLSVLYAWDSYDPPQLVAGLVAGPELSATGTAVNMAVGTQVPYGIDYLIGATVSQPVAWLGLLGAVLLMAESRRWTSTPRVLAHLTLLLWVLLLFVGSRIPLTGFPQRFGRDVGIPLAILAAFALVMILRSLLQQRKPAVVLAGALAVALAGSLIYLGLAQSFYRAAGPSPHLIITPQIAAAGEWLREHNNGGNIMVSPQGAQHASRMMLATGGYSALQSFTGRQIRHPRDLPPTGPKPLKDVLQVMHHPGGERTPQLLKRYDVRYIVLYKYLPDRPIRPNQGYWKSFKAWPELYRIAFENDDVLIVAPRRA
jgi:hypothetical protein